MWRCSSEDDLTNTRSRVSAVSTLSALAEKGHEVIAIGIDREGEFHRADPSAIHWSPKVHRCNSRFLAAGCSDTVKPITFDVAFPVLHGPFGEDGTIQGLFEMAGSGMSERGCSALRSPWTKTSPSDCAAMRVSPSESTSSYAAPSSSPHRVTPRQRSAASWGFRCSSSPANLGSSVGIGRAEDEASLKDAIHAAMAHDSKVLVEAEVKGREIEVAVLEGPRASLPARSSWRTVGTRMRPSTRTMPPGSRCPRT